MDPTYPLVPFANFIGCLLILLPMLTCMTYSIGICAFAAWAILFGFGQGVNSIVWKDNTNDIAPVWCDLTTHIFLATNVALPACSLVITRHLYRIISRRDALRISVAQKHREFAFDLALCVGFPILSMIFYYIVQVDRYDIIEEKGCADHWLPTGLSILLLEIWIPLFPTISTLFYAPRIIYVYYHNRREIHEHLKSKSSMKGEGNYFRILALGTIDGVLTLPLGILKVVANHSRSRASLVFYPGWTAVHAHWAPERIPAALWRSNVWAVYAVRFDQWVCPFLGLVIFALCGLHKEARVKYRRVFGLVYGRLRGQRRRAQAAGMSGEASTIRFGSANAGANVSANDPTMISLGSVNSAQDAQDSIMTRRSKDEDEEDIEAYGSHCNYAMKDLPDVRSIPQPSISESTTHFDIRTAAGEATKTKVYEPSLIEPATDVTLIHEIDLGLNTYIMKDRGDDGGELDRSNGLPIQS